MALIHLSNMSLLSTHEHLMVLLNADTMMKFASFETVVEMIYKYAIPAPKNECSKNLQLVVSFAGGYIAGVFCAIVSHPADNLVSLTMPRGQRSAMYVF